MIIWGGTQRIEKEPPLADGAAYDPRTDSWRSLPRSPLGPRYEHAAAWTDEGMAVWSGAAGTPPPLAGGPALADGALYHPDTDGWQALPASPLAARYRTSAAWTGEELIVWGGCCQGTTGRGSMDGAVIAFP